MSWLRVAIFAVLVVTLVEGATNPVCRFAKQYTQEQLLNNKTAQQQFINDVMYWEGNFHKHKVGVNMILGVTYDGHAINYTTGELAEPLHTFSAPSKESIHVAMLALALTGNPQAQMFINNTATTPQEAVDTAIDILEKKINTYEQFNRTFPGYGGFLPWFSVNDTAIAPTSDWMNRVPALDNGELVWSLYAVYNILEDMNYTSLANRYRNYFQYMAKNSLMVFYIGEGRIVTVTIIKDMYAAPYPENYSEQMPCCCPCYLDDPYEGEMMAVFMDLFAPWPNVNERNAIWTIKKPKIQPVNYEVYSYNITCQRGYWFSAHENWKYLELPYMDVPINKEIYQNGERARTWNSVLKGIPGLYASVNDVTPYPDENPNYLSATGVPEIAFKPSLENTTVTPYGSFNLFLTQDPQGFAVGLAWYHNMLMGPRMQNPFGSTEACNVTGTAISPVVTWDSKITTALAMTGGISSLNAKYLQRDGLYYRFTSVIQTEWEDKFSGPITGSKLPYVPPKVTIPDTLGDFPSCTVNN